MPNAKTDYSMSVNVKADISQAQKTLDQLTNPTNKRKVIFDLDFDTKDILPKLDSVINNQIGRKVDDSMKRISTNIKTNLTGAFKGEWYTGITKVTETFKNALGDVQERTSLFTKGGQNITSTLQTIKHGIQETSTQTEKYSEVLGETEVQVTKVTKVLTDTAGETKTVIETTREWTDASGRLNTEITTTNEKGEQLAPTVKKIGEAAKETAVGIDKITTSTQTFNQNIDGIETKVSQVTKTITDVNGNEQIVTETTKEWTDANGRLHQSLEVVDEDGNQLKPVVENIVEDLTKLDNVVVNTSKSVDVFSTKSGATVTVIKELNKAGEEFKTVITEEEDAQKRLVKTTEVWNETTKSLVSTHKEVINDQKKLKAEQEKLQETLVRTSKSTDIIRNSAGDLVTTIEEINSKGERLRTVITEHNNGLGRITTTTQQYNVTTGKLIKNTSESINNIAKETDAIREQTKAREQLNNVTRSDTLTKKGSVVDWDTGKSFEGLITTITTVDAEGKQVTKTIEKFTNAEGRLVEQTRTLDANMQKVANDSRVVNDNFKQTENSIKKTGNAARQTAQDTKTLGESFSGAIARLAKYYLASLPIRAVRMGIQETIQTVKDFDTALIEFRKVSDLAGESLTNYVSKLAEMGELTGSTMQAMVEASTEFRKSGFTDEDSAKLASIAEKYRNIADEEISAGESASFIIAQMKAFNIEADTAEHIIDSVNEV